MRKTKKLLLLGLGFVLSIGVTACGSASSEDMEMMDSESAAIELDGKEQLCGARGLPECDDGMFCDFPPESSCGQTDVPGVCKKKPIACPLRHDPVCGCDSETYGNACLANTAGVSVAHRGACDADPEPRVCGTIVGLGCEKGEYCDFGVGQCNVADAAGVCRPVPQACKEIYDPVCGCNGKTYGNACFAAMAGAQIDHEGKCH